jgi:hypothetical protein
MQELKERFRRRALGDQEIVAEQFQAVEELFQKKWETILKNNRANWEVK